MAKDKVAATVPDTQTEPVSEVSTDMASLLQAENAQLKAKIDALQAEKDAADKTIANLLEATKQMAAGGGESSVIIDQEAKAPVIPAPVEMDGKTVTFLKPLFSLNGVDYTAEQAAGLPDLIESILSIEGQKIVAVS